MKFILEFKSFYDVGDTIIIEYWYDMLTPVKIVEKISKCLLRLHDIPESEIKGAPDEIIKSSDI
jgi:hypothetical protein